LTAHNCLRIAALVVAFDKVVGRLELFDT